MDRIIAADYAQALARALPSGVLLTTKAEGKVDSMVIGWGTIGIIWGRPMVTVYVREGRYTRELLDSNPEFTINIPDGAADPDVIRICGSRSGRDTDKVAEAGLTLVCGQEVSVPAVREFPVTLECRLVYRQAQDLSLLPDDLVERYYPQDVPGTAPLANRDYHVAYYGEIVAAYTLE